MGNNHPVPSSWWRHPYCYYCGRLVVKSKATRWANIPPQTGTIEHIPPKWVARLGTGLPVERVLACYKCNNRENKRVQLLFPSFFLVLWLEGRITEPRRKMLPPPAAAEDQDHQQDDDPQSKD